MKTDTLDAQRLRDEETGGVRRPAGPARWAVVVIALCWSLFQLSLASWLLWESPYIRPAQPAFAVACVQPPSPASFGSVPSLTSNPSSAPSSSESASFGSVSS